MSCKLVYNQDKQFVKALTPNGEESTLFKQILKIPHIKTIEDAVDLYSNIFSKKMYSIIGEKGAKQLDQAEEVTFRLDNLRIAKEMEQAGKTPQEIRLLTNWEKGLNSKWEYEISPNLKIKTLKINNKSFSQVIDYPEIEKAYPKVKNVTFSVEPFQDVDFDANFDATNNRIQIADYLTEDEELLKSKILHELQHKLQLLEGWNPISRQQIEDMSSPSFGTGLKSPYSDVSDNSKELLDSVLEDFLEVKDLNLKNYIESTNNNNLLKLLKYYFNTDLNEVSTVKEAIKTLEINGKKQTFFNGQDFENSKQGVLDLLKSDIEERKNRTGLFSLKEAEDVVSKGETDTFEYDDAVFMVKALNNYQSNLEAVERGMYKVTPTTPSLKLEVLSIMTEFYGERFSDLKNIFVYNRLKDYFDKDAIDSFDLYWISQSEVEARNVEKRMNMTAQQRRETLLQETEDVAREDQIFLRGESEPQLSFSSDNGTNHKDFRSALLDSKGGDITIEFDNEVVGTISSKQDLETEGGTINYLVANDMLADDTIVENNKVYLKAGGFDMRKQLVNENVLNEYFPLAKIHRDGRIELRERVKPSPIRNIFNALAPLEPQLDENALKSRILEFLEEMGISVTTIENYEKAFKTKKGHAPSIEAFIDFAKNIMAFKDGQIGTEILSEEFAHFVIESWNQTEVDNLLRNIHKTETFQKFYQEYYDIYRSENPNMTDQEIDLLTRKEILGKELAKNLLDKFNPQGKDRSILNKMLDLFLDFFRKIFVGENYQERLDKLTDQVNDMLINKEARALFSPVKGKKFKMYSIQHSTLTKTLLNQEQTLVKMGKGSTERVKELNRRLKKSLEDDTISYLATLARRQTAYVREAVKSASKKGVAFSVEENLTLQNLLNSIRPALDTMVNSLSSDPAYKRDVDAMKKTLEEISTVSAEFQRTENIVLDRLAERLAQRYPNYGDAQKIKTELETVRRDTNYMYSYFGQISHASDPILQALSLVASDIYQESNENFNTRANDFLNLLRDNKLTPEEFAEVVGKDGYIISKYDFPEFKEYEKYAKAFAYKKYLPQIIADLESKLKDEPDVKAELDEHKRMANLTDEVLLAEFDGIPAITNREILSQVMADATSIINKGAETNLSDDEVKRREEQDANLHPATRAKIRAFKEARALISRSRKLSPSGVPILSRQNKFDIEHLNLERREALSIYDKNGQFKKGLSLTNTDLSQGIPTVRSVKIKIDDKYLNLDTTTATQEAIVAFEMQAMQQAIPTRASGLTQAFLDDIAKMEADTDNFTREDIVDFVRLNSTVGFSDSYFEREMNDAFEPLKTADYATPELRDEIDILLAQYEELAKERRNIINLFRDPNNSTNTLGQNISEIDKGTIKDKTKEIEDAFFKIMAFAKKQKIEVKFEEDGITAKSPNQNYYDSLRDEGISTDIDRLNFAMKHMSDESLKSVNGFKLAVLSGNISTRYSSIVARFGNDESAVLKYAESKMLPYYTSSAPTALLQYQDQLRNSTTPVSTLLEQLEEEKDTVKITVAYDYMDVVKDDILNKQKDPTYQSNTREPSLRKTPNIFVDNGGDPKSNSVFNKTWNFANKEYSKIANNPKLQRAQEIAVAVNKQNLENYAVDQYSNPYKIPQVPRTTFDAIKGINKATLKEFVERATTYREDEQEFGESAELFKAGVRVIPKQYLMDLPQGEVSQDLAYSLMAMAQQTELYKARVKYYGEVSALEQALMSRSNVGGKQVQMSNTYAMFKSATDNFMFGVQEIHQMRVSGIPIVGTVDVSKVLKSFGRYVSRLTMSFNAVIPVTSMLTAFNTFLTEPLVKQYIDADSYKKGTLAFKDTAYDAIKETGKLNSKAKLTVIGNHFGIFKFKERFENSTASVFNRRTTTQLQYGAHTAANFPPLSQAMLTALIAHRVIGGKLMTVDQFKGTKSEWRNAKSLYDYIEVEDGKLNYNSSLYTDLGTTPEEFKNIERGVSARVGKIVERIDGQIKPWDKTTAQRNFLLSWTMLHKSWLAIGMANAFKGRQFNLSTGQLEEGKYVSAVKHFRDMFVLVKEKGFKGFFEDYNKLDEVAKIGARRSLADLAVLLTTTLIYLLLKGVADDDEENYGKQLAWYLALRTKNETVSSQFGIVGEFYKSVQEPIVGLSRIKSVLSLFNLLDFDEIERGRYKGLTYSQKYLLQAIPSVKPFYDLNSSDNIRSQANSYEFFNRENEAFNVFKYLITDRIEE